MEWQTRLLVAAVLLLLLSKEAEAAAREQYMTADALRDNPLALKSNPNRGCDESPTVGMDCPEGWSLQIDAEGAVCLWLSNDTSPQDDANDTCQAMGGNLVSIRSPARQETIRNYLRGVNKEIWTGGYKSYDSNHYTWPGGDIVMYTPLKNGLQYRYTPWVTICLALQADVERTWQELSDCGLLQLFLCDVKPECHSNRVGPLCNGVCHCLGGEVCQGGQPCSAGCKRGQTGPHCCQRQKPAAVAYYCVSGIWTFMELRVDPRTTSYEALQPVDAQGQNQDWCSHIIVTHDPQDYTYTIRVPVFTRADGFVHPTSEPQPKCGMEKTGNNTYTWRLSLEEKKGIRLPFDRSLVITCDFDHAESMERGMEYAIQPENERAVDLMELEPTREDVTLEVIDHTTGDVIHQAELGQTVELRMRLNVSGGVRARGVSPYKCKASGQGGKPMRHLTGLNGCALSAGPMSSLRGVNGTVTSRAFHLFAFPGQDTVTISCLFHFCFTELEQPMCDDYCTYKNSGRQRRAADSKPESLATTIRILPAKDSRFILRSVSSNNGSHLTASNAMTPVTCLLVAILVVKFAMLF